MALWLNRAGAQGQHLTKFLEDSRIYLTWGGLDHDLSEVASKADLSTLLREVYPDMGAVKLANHTGQLWRFVHEMQISDWVIVPDKITRSINIAEITGDYTFVPDGPDPYFHFHSVRWVGNDIPRTNFDPDLLYSFGGLMTIYKVERNDAEQRVRAMQSHSWKAPGVTEHLTADGESAIDLEELARDDIAKLIVTRFKGHGLARLVEAVLRAQGYTTYRSPEGADKGIDILAGLGPLGFDDPRICVQVKSGDSAIDHPTLNQLIGAMQNVGAPQGLLVSWGGFKPTVRREEPPQFFRVRLWNQQTLVDEILRNYDRLDEDIRAELPLKRIWAVAKGSTEEAVAAEEQAQG